MRRVALLTVLAVLALAGCSHDPSSPQSPSSPPSASSAVVGHGNETVHVTKTGPNYHVEGCAEIGAGDMPISLKDAVDYGYKPCPKCNPPTLK